ncbi:hypothetical protein [Ornithinibacillus bavariensis]|uniref:Uncharacterized protein n=1 Tax=Ornithinibacillus bavariensis TaxID=545502 RepID=A0A920C767_9BACI|nr:hypothetical protein [Ornithinibacillus bavariensis]GIO26844.1 hypothetical protein J43TS3_14550 [Ornithinibacillus bavariensis]HAM80708.1 hypothetical protein [Ornithinibacillus sp.]
MKVLIASEVPIEKVEAFINTTDQVDKESLIQDGYLVEINGEIKACFVLSSVKGGVYWLKQLYIAKEAAMNLPILFETIIVLVKEKRAKKLYVHSHQPIVDILLDALQFHPQNEAIDIQSYQQNEGNWWAYEVS